MPDVRGLMADPEFQALPLERRKSILARINPQLAQEYGAPITPRTEGPALAGRQSELRNAPKRGYGLRDFAKAASGWNTWEQVRDALWGTQENQQERAEAREAGVGLQPTAGELLEAGVDASAFAGGATGLARAGAGAGAAMLARGRGVPAQIGRYALEHPKTTGAVIDAAPELLRGDLRGAAGDAVTGAALGGLVGGPGRRILRRVRGAPPTPAPPVPAPPADMDPAAAMRRAKELVAEGKNEEARAILEAVRSRAAPAVEALPDDLARALRKAGVPKADIARMTTAEARAKLERLPKPGNVTMPGTLPNVAKQAPGTISTESAALIDKQVALVGENLDNPLIDPAARAAATAVRVDRGRAAAEAHAKRVALAKKATAGTPWKYDSEGDQKVWMRLDDQGEPVEVITSAQAAAATRKGEKTTWVKRLWK